MAQTILVTGNTSGLRRLIVEKLVCQVFNGAAAQAMQPFFSVLHMPATAFASQRG